MLHAAEILLLLLQNIMWLVSVQAGETLCKNIFLDSRNINILQEKAHSAANMEMSVQVQNISSDMPQANYSL